MFEREGLYALITHIGNAVEEEPPAPLYAKGNGDTWRLYQERKEKYKAYLNRRDMWFGETWTLAQLIPKRDLSKSGYWGTSKRKALSFFFHPEKWADCFIKNTFGSAEDAFWKTGTKENLAEAYLQWFEEERKELRDKMKDAITAIDQKAEIAKISGKQITHGGVANLLKVLTKTMEKQGADIRSIAKVQYAICKQAGILIPDEFIEDVAVVLCAEGSLDK